MVSRDRPSSRRHVVPDYTFRTEREAAQKAQQLADETGERWWTWEADLATERSNPKGRTRFDKCVRAVSRSRSAADPRAVCGAMRARGTLKRGNKAVPGEYIEYRVSVSKALPGQRKPGAFITGSKQDRDEAIRTLMQEWGYKRGQIHVSQRKQYPLPSLFTRGKHKRTNRGRRNDVPAAQDRYERFHGHPSKELVEVVTPIHVHTALSGMGELRKLVIRQKGARVTIKNFKGAILCQNEKATQLFIEGGDQAVNLADFGIRQPYHEKEVLGECTDVYYFTTKDHLAPQDGGTATYHHKFGRKKPTIVYDVPNALLEFAGGGYTIPDEGIDA